jgi:predicted Zn-dependent protease
VARGPEQPDPRRRPARDDEAVRHYTAAARLIPANTLLLNEWAELDFTRRRDFAAAEEKLQRSLRLDPSFDYTHAALGDMYMARAKAARAIQPGTTGKRRRPTPGVGPCGTP